MSGAFTPDPSLPSILELAKKLWGEPTDWSADKNEVRFGANGSKSIKIRECVWRDHEANEGGGYLEIYRKAEGAPPPRKAGNGHDKTYDGPKPWLDIDKIYPYVNDAGVLVLEVIRTKSRNPRFRQRKPDASKPFGWDWKTRDIPYARRPLYRLPQLLAADETDLVFITEGEKDANNLAERGLIATTNSGGAGKWCPEYAEAFRGKHVVVLPDNDPAGEGHIRVVAGSVHGVAASLRVLALPGLGHKGDVSDWLAAGGTAGELQRQALEAPLWMPPLLEEPEEGPERPDEGGGEGGGGGDGGGGDGPDDPDPPLPEVDAGALLTEQYVARTFVQLFQNDLRYNHSSKSWLVWSVHFWKPDNRKLAFSWALNLCRELAASIGGRDARQGQLVVEKVRFSAAVEQGASALPPLATAQEDWDADPWLLGTPGGIVDLKTGELRPGERDDRISRLASVTPSQVPECPTWDGFLEFATHGDGELLRFIKRYFGYCLTGVTSEEVFLFLFGPGGAGKGTLMETVSHILGDYAGTTPMEVFTARSIASNAEYYRADMVGKRLIVANEPERGAFWAEAFIKESTGGDTLSGRFPAGRVFRFKPTHKLALLGNHMPRLRGQSSGMARRLRILPFDRKPEEPDRGLKAKLLAEGPGILRWLIEGCLAWQKIGLDPPQSVLVASNRYFEDQDTFARFVDEACILGEYLELAPDVLRKGFNEWAKANGYEEMTGNAFAEAIDQFEPPVTDPPTMPLKRGKTMNRRWVRGIGLKPVAVVNRWSDP